MYDFVEKSINGDKTMYSITVENAWGLDNFF